jgi:hypothetical protein
MSVALVAPDVTEPDQRVDGSAKGLPAHPEPALELDEPHAPSGLEQGQGRRGPAMVEERLQLIR